MSVCMCICVRVGERQRNAKSRAESAVRRQLWYPKPKKKHIEIENF